MSVRLGFHNVVPALPTAYLPGIPNQFSRWAATVIHFDNSQGCHGQSHHLSESCFE
jgi:hypothetical protein